MKRYGNLYPQIVDFNNLYLAAKKAQKGKRYKDNVLEFNYHLETELLTLQKELEQQTYQPGDYRTFHITDPKSRLISASPYRDRVIHHALCNIIIPIFERTFIDESYANRIGFGSHRALRRFIQYARSHRYVLQCDISKYFPSIDHEILKKQLRRKLKCHKTLWLIDKIIDNSNEQEPVIHYFTGDNLLTPLERRRGLPIGNLTSQLFANIYLNGLDHYLKEVHQVGNYVRYVDDFALFSDDKDFLAHVKQQIQTYLIDLRLKIHPVKSQLFETKHGATFLGFRVLEDRLRVSNRNLRRGRKRLRCLQSDYAQNKIELNKLVQSIQSWEAHLDHGDTYQLRQKIFSNLIFQRN